MLKNVQTMFKVFKMFSPQDFLSTFGQFSTLCMEGLNVTVKAEVTPSLRLGKPEKRTCIFKTRLTRTSVPVRLASAHATGSSAYFSSSESSNSYCTKLLEVLVLRDGVFSKTPCCFWMAALSSCWFNSNSCSSFKSSYMYSDGISLSP